MLFDLKTATKFNGGLSVGQDIGGIELYIGRKAAVDAESVLQMKYSFSNVALNDSIGATFVD